MKRRIAIILLWLLVFGCVTVPKSNPLNISSLSSFEAQGLSLRLPSGFKKFTEERAVLFRPEPPVRPSPGVLVMCEEGTKPEVLLNRAYQKVATKMGGVPLYIKGTIAGREVRGLQDQLATHLIWLYVIPEGKVVWLLQIIAPIEWTDEQALAFHDVVCKNIEIEK